MILFLAAQDIRFADFGLVDAGALKESARVDAPPERYLAELDRLLAAWKAGPGDISAVAVVTGPGAFTASRVSTVLADAIAFALDVPVIPLENPGRRPLADLAPALPAARTTHAVPVYDREANITRKK